MLMQLCHQYTYPFEVLRRQVFVVEAPIHPAKEDTGARLWDTRRGGSGQE